MPDPRQERLEALFHRAAELAGTERNALLERECADDAALRDELEAMLRALDEGTKGILGTPVVPGNDAFNLDVTLPSHIGEYRIIRLLGEGGMGTVYEAEQLNPRRTVAIKIVRPGLLSRNMIRRFKQESQILGQLKHPGIAQIYEAGAIELPALGGMTPFFAMEFVAGAPLLEYAHHHQLCVRERMALISKLCDAVTHAHQRGVIHRDLKPANILVETSVAGEHSASDQREDRSARRTPLFEVGQPKILDFGIARAADADTHRVTMQTDPGQIIGTLAYMSPEQATGDPSKVDARSGVYALGVILYELLAGRLPVDVASRPVPEAARLIREEEPTRLGSIRSACRGDIETIVAKALEKDAGRRYRSAADLGADIRRYLRDEPIVARPASTLCQLGKFARRHRGLVAGIATTFVALLIGLIGMSYLAVKERQQRHMADRRAYRAGIAAAQSALENDDVTLARAALSAIPTADAGWEWRYLDRKARSWIKQFTIEPIGSDAHIAVTPDGTVIAVSSDAHPESINLWNGTTGEFIRKVPISSDNIVQMTFGRDATRLFLTRGKGSMEMWRLSPDERVWATDPQGFSGWPATVSPDGRLIACSLAVDREVAVLDTQTGAVMRRLSFQSLLPGPVFSPDSILLGVTGEAKEGQSAIFELRTGRQIWSGHGYFFHAFNQGSDRAVLSKRAIPH